MRRAIIGAALLLSWAALLTGCGGSENRPTGDDYEGNISISGAFALYPLTVAWADTFQKIHPKIRIDISAGGAGKGMADALSGMVDLGMFSRGITPEERAKGCWWIAVAKDAVLPTVNSQNPWLDQLKKKGIPREVFEKIYLSDEPVNWAYLLDAPAGQRLNVYTRSDACGAAQMWGEYLGKDKESLRGIGVFGDPGMADAVKRDPYGVGYNNVIYVFDLKTHRCYAGMEVIPIDLDANGAITDDENFYGTLDDIMAAIGENRYPSPPARDLYLVAQGKPSRKATLLFLEWILTEGQSMVNQAGYVRLPAEKIQAGLEKLNQ